ncbi:MAG: GGDEF domain-containing protein [Burkholderiaceae bacterium]|nr:GGDEF domain-containing protein [Burkholderiaceae bacterium]
MDALIRHMVGITGQRDHRLLEISVVRALHELAEAARVRAFAIFNIDEDLYVRPRVWMQNGRIISSEEATGEDHGGDSIAAFPALQACISGHVNCAEETTAEGESVLWLPIWLNDKVSSCLQISNPMPFSKSARDVIEGIIGVYRNYHSLLDYSERDSLTGLLNRKTFDEKFARMAMESVPADHHAGSERRQGMHVPEQWLAVADVDHFKSVNDRFGHLYGDEVLILIANMLRRSFRDHDRIFRFGGEEFVILLRSTSRDDARKAFERFRAEVERQQFPQVGRMTVSLGFARINARETPVMLLGNADRALYYAKINGRNRVCSFEELVQSGELQVAMAQASAEFFFDS